MPAHKPPAKCVTIATLVRSRSLIPLKNRMPADEFLLGHQINVGDRLE